jgi:hypothetical protein
MFYAQLLSRVAPRYSINLLSKVVFGPYVMFLSAHLSLLCGVTRWNNLFIYVYNIEICIYIYIYIYINNISLSLSLSIYIYIYIYNSPNERRLRVSLSLSIYIYIYNSPNKRRFRGPGGVGRGLDSVARPVNGNYSPLWSPACSPDYFSLGCPPENSAHVAL